MTKSREWLKETYWTIGGSSAAAVVGMSPWCTPQELNRKMRDVIHRDIIRVDDPSPAMARGIRMESVVREMLQAEYEWEISTDDRARMTSLYPWAHARTDGVSVAPEGITVHEIKCPGFKAVREFLNSGLPDQYILQGIHNAAIVNAARTMFTVYDYEQHKLHNVTLDFDKNQAAVLMEAEEIFYAAVLADDDWTDGMAESLPKPDVAKIEFESTPFKIENSEHEALVLRLIELKESKAEVEDLIEDLQDRCRQLLPKDRNRLVIPSGVGLSFSTQTRKTFKHKEAIAKHPELDSPENWQVSDEFVVCRVFGKKKAEAFCG